MDFSNQKKNITITLITFFVLVASIIFIYFIFDSFNKNSIELVKLKQELATFQKKSKSLEETKKDYMSWQPSLEKIDEMFIDADAPIDFIEFLEDTSISCGLKSDISSSNSSSASSNDADSDESKEWDFLYFQISLVGSYENILKFLEKIETGPYFITEESLNIKKISVKEYEYSGYSPNDVNAILGVKAYSK